jgi:zinc protease
LRQVILEPRFDREIFDLHKKRYLEGIRHRYDKPRGVMHPAYEHVMFGSHPYNWMATEKEASSVALKQLSRLKGRGFDLNQLVIAVSGDFDKQEMIDSLNRFLAAFKSDSASRRIKIPEYKGPKPTGIYVIDKDFSQATIQVGFPGLKRPHPDYYPLAVANYIFGSGGFTSRLTAKVRTEEGLAYVVRSFVQSDYYRKGTVGFYLQTKAETGELAITYCFDELKRMADSGITEKELQRAKDGLIQSFPSLFDTPSATANIFARSEIWKRNLDHFEKYPQKIRAITRKQVDEVFRKYFVTDSARIVVVGPKDKLLQKDSEKAVSLSDLGKITELTTSDIEAK